MKTRLVPAAVAALALTAAAVTFTPVSADAVGAGAHKPMQGFTQDVGVKHVVGYFAPKNGTCATTLMVTDRVDPDFAPGAATRVRFTLPAGQTATVESGDGALVAVSCARDAGSLTVTAEGGA